MWKLLFYAICVFNFCSTLLGVYLSLVMINLPHPEDAMYGRVAYAFFIFCNLSNTVVGLYHAHISN